MHINNFEDFVFESKLVEDAEVLKYKDEIKEIDEWLTSVYTNVDFEKFPKVESDEFDIYSNFDIKNFYGKNIDEMIDGMKDAKLSNKVISSLFVKIGDIPITIFLLNSTDKFAGAAATVEHEILVPYDGKFIRSYCIIYRVTKWEIRNVATDIYGKNHERKRHLGLILHEITHVIDIFKKRTANKTYFSTSRAQEIEDAMIQLSQMLKNSSDNIEDIKSKSKHSSANDYVSKMLKSDKKFRKFVDRVKKIADNENMSIEPFKYVNTQVAIIFKSAYICLNETEINAYLTQCVIDAQFRFEYDNLLKYIIDSCNKLYKVLLDNIKSDDPTVNVLILCVISIVDDMVKKEGFKDKSDAKKVKFFFDKVIKNAKTIRKKLDKISAKYPNGLNDALKVTLEQSEDIHDRLRRFKENNKMKKLSKFIVDSTDENK